MKKKEKYKMDRDFLEEMRSQEFYNEKPIKGYNHLTGTLDPKDRPRSQYTKVCDVDLNVCMLLQYD